MLPNGHYINGEWHKGQGSVFSSYNPMTNHTVWQGQIATEDEITKAYDAAQSALVDWIDCPDRGHYLREFAKRIRHHQAILAHVISEETGKPLWESLTEVSAVIQKITFSEDAYKLRTSEYTVPATDMTARVRYKPHGVVAVLGAFNFPAHLSNGHIVPALLAGNTVIYKPSELAPGVASLMMQCWHESGIPAGVIQCIQGDKSAAERLLMKPIQGVYFTGSYQAGKSIHYAFRDRPEVILALEMGGNNPLVVGDVENVDAAIYHIILSSFLTAGQRCSSARRLFIPDTPAGNTLLEQLIERVKLLHYGAYDTDPEPFMGPVISRSHALNHVDAQNKLIDLGGKPFIKMQLVDDVSALLSPGLIDMTAVSHAPDKEIFAPLLQVYRYDNFDNALSMANQTQYGLSAGLLSDDEAQYRTFYRTIRAGIINWNRPTTGALSSLPFGGVGASGNHHPSAFFAADYCVYPISSLEQSVVTYPNPIPQSLKG